MEADWLGDGGGVDQTGPPVHWPSVLPEDAGQEWEALRCWVERLIDRFGLDARTIPPCWYRHNTQVEALQALRDYERGCYNPTAPPTAGVDFLRALTEVRRFLVEAAGRTQCTINDHRDDPHRLPSDTGAGWDELVRADIAQRNRADPA